ncbi:NAD(P)/FAD-dependent oxidoreductase [Thiorhodococcus minor]|uniref:NAD(P)/FAD-dependent oxidoreductase n=1 Tax=Thiorhodococcus minor TaxID=57489 RepID=A0A6M0K0F7_9GAMM|nr:NAD(P)/FAD-dependent oxidoreductase [Thiorhodococcus minor]NEV63256.1 NAD(P)/FAD-dependent oxidoreductase [Thiorhodococcus minor]
MKASERPSAVIIGGGPAGLTAAYELVTRSDIRPIVLEADAILGGISRTVDHKGNRIDLGGHRFFSKSDRVMDWWRQVLPIQGMPAADAPRVEIQYQNQRRMIPVDPGGPDPATHDAVMLIRPRVSRILFRGQLFDYPLTPSLKTLRQLGVGPSIRILGSYAYCRVRRIRPEISLEDFLINRFGRELYATFFRDYTQKVWGVPCDEIPADWGRQRIKGLSVAGLLSHAARSLLGRAGALHQRDTETSLIEQFMYPKLGPGQLWERVAGMVTARGGEVRLQHCVTGIEHQGGRICVVRVSTPSGEQRLEVDWLFSSMPVKHLIAGLAPAAPDPVRAVADGLMYRDFMTVGLLLDRLKLGGDVTGQELYSRVPDNWIYVQEPGVRVGRLQFFNNWSPYMVADPKRVWVGLEYFVNEGDDLWSLADADMVRFAIEELERIGVIDAGAVLDHRVIRMPKAYPAYFGSYDRFELVRDYLQGFQNLFPIGRNGMHRYNNQDHSMLTAMMAVDGILSGEDVRQQIWEVNTEQAYHEEKKDGRWP